MDCFAALAMTAGSSPCPEMLQHVFGAQRANFVVEIDELRQQRQRGLRSSGPRGCSILSCARSTGDMMSRNGCTRFGQMGRRRLSSRDGLRSIKPCLQPLDHVTQCGQSNRSPPTAAWRRCQGWVDRHPRGILHRRQVERPIRTKIGRDLLHPAKQVAGRGGAASIVMGGFTRHRAACPARRRRRLDFLVAASPQQARKRRTSTPEARCWLRRRRRSASSAAPKQNGPCSSDQRQADGPSPVKSPGPFRRFAWAAKTGNRARTSVHG